MKSSARPNFGVQFGLLKIVSCMQLRLRSITVIGSSQWAIAKLREVVGWDAGAIVGQGAEVWRRALSLIMTSQ